MSQDADDILPDVHRKDKRAVRYKRVILSAL